MQNIKTVDVRGLNCPEPILLTLEALQGMPGGELVVLVDTGTSQENVIRLVTKNGWKVTDEKQPDGSRRLTLKK